MSRNRRSLFLALGLIAGWFAPQGSGPAGCGVASAAGPEAPAVGTPSQAPVSAIAVTVTDTAAAQRIVCR